MRNLCSRVTRTPVSPLQLFPSWTPPLVVLEIFVSGPETGPTGGSGFFGPVLFSMNLAADEFLFVIVTVISVAPSPSGGLFATGSGDMRARIWRLVLLVFTSPHNFLSFFPSNPDRIILFLSPAISYFFFLFFALFYPTKSGILDPCPHVLFSSFWCGMKNFRLDNLTDVCGCCSYEPYHHPPL